MNLVTSGHYQITRQKYIQHYFHNLFYVKEIEIHMAAFLALGTRIVSQKINASRLGWKTAQVRVL